MNVVFEAFKAVTVTVIAVPAWLEVAVLTVKCVADGAGGVPTRSLTIWLAIGVPRPVTRS